MRRELWVAALLIPLSGCYAPPADPGYGYAQPGYPSNGYPPSGYPAGYEASPYDTDARAYPGYSYNGGAPTYIDGGIAVPLVLFGGEWGYYDHDRHWRRAPDRISHDLEAHRAGGGQFHPNAVPRGEPGFQPRPGQLDDRAAFRPPEQPRPVSPQAAFRPPEQPHFAPPQAAFRPADPPRPAFTAPPPAAQQHHEEHGRGRDCPPGQRC
jgi:hypothetical protein